MGYSAAQIEDLARTIDAVPCDVVLLGTPIDLRRVLRVKHPMLRVRYAMEDVEGEALDEVLGPHARSLGRELARAERGLATGVPDVQDRAPGG